MKYCDKNCQAWALCHPNNSREHDIDFGGQDCIRRQMIYQENYGLKAPLEPEHIVTINDFINDIKNKKN